MELSVDLISQFAKLTTEKEKPKSETTVYGVTVEYEGRMYVKFDGSDLLTPVLTTTDMVAGERVSVLLKNHTATVTGNLTSPSARTDDMKAVGSAVGELSSKISEFEIIIADKVTTEDLDAINGRIDTLVSDNVTVKQNLTAAEGDISKLETDKLDAATAEITYAKITDLNATSADINNLEADVAELDTLIYGSATGNTIHSSFANAVVAQLSNAQIKSAMIESVSASKITSGDIITNNVRVMSEDGSLIISDETIQIKDGTRVRVQIGKDTSNDYSINIWDTDGNLMFSEGGITDNAIKTAIIRNDMVSDTANIAAHKLDINSLFEEINGSTKTIKSSKIYLDDEKQTLDVAFETMSTDLTELQNGVSTQGTHISVIQNQIETKVWQQDIDAVSENLSTQYTTLEQEVDGITATVARHTSEIASKADNTTVTEIDDKVSELEQNVNGFKTTVSETYATKTDIDTRISTTESSVTQLSDKINTNVIDINALDTRMSTIEQTADGLAVRLDSTKQEVDDAAKTATNYMNFSGSGLVVGDMTANSLGKNVRIDSDSVDVRNGETVLASFGANELILGQNAADSTINLCDGAGVISTITSGATTSYPHYDGINISSEEIELDSSNFQVVATNGSTYVNTGTIDLTNQSSAAGSVSAFKSECKITSSGSRLSTGILASASSSASTTRTDIYASHYNASSGATNSNYISVYPTHTQMSKPLTINNVYVTALNKLLWSGSNYMNASQSITLSEAVSAQVNGIVLVWSYYESGAAKNYNFHCHFVPKWLVSNYAGTGSDYFLANQTGNVLGHKYLYISDTKITGNDYNDDGNLVGSRVTYTNTAFVLRAVIGV